VNPIDDAVEPGPQVEPAPAMAFPTTPTAPAGDPGMSMGRAATLGLLSSGAGVLIGIARSKVTAHVLGPEGIGQSAELNQLIGLAMVPVAMFTGPALLSMIAKARADNDLAGLTRTYRSAMSAVLTVGGVTLTAAVIAGYWVLPASWGRALWPLLFPAALTALIGQLAGIPNQVLTPYGLLRTVTFQTFLVSLVGSLLGVLGTIWFGLRGQFYGVLAATLLLAPTAFWLASKRLPTFSWRFRPEIDPAFLKYAGALGVSSLVVGLANQGFLIGVRSALESAGGPEFNGQFQAAWLVGTTYFGMIGTSLGNFAFPRYAAARTVAELESEVVAAMAFVHRLMPPMVLTLIAVRAPILRLLYSHRFDPAIELLGLLLISDIIKGPAWVIAGPLLYRGKVVAMLIVESVGCALLAGLAWFFVPRLGLAGVGVGAVVSYALYTIVSAVALKQSCGVALPWRTYGITAASALVAGASLWCSTRWPVSGILVLGVAVVWGAVTGIWQELLGRVWQRAARAVNLLTHSLLGRNK
jgi:O-antigen/teichoic acid export membrane protein